MIVFAVRTGRVEALPLDNGHPTDMRTAVTGAVAARWLAREDARSVAILGTGMQARMPLRALAPVRQIRRAAPWERDPGKAKDVAREMAEAQGMDVRAGTDAATAVVGADVVVTTIPARTPIRKAGWLRPGQHLTAMGPDRHGKNGMAAECLGGARHVAGRLSRTRTPGEPRTAITAGIVAGDAEFAELRHIIAGNAAGCGSKDEITLADLAGPGVQDTAIASFALERAAAGAGTGSEN